MTFGLRSVFLAAGAASAALLLSAAAAAKPPEVYARHGEVMLARDGAAPLALTHLGKVSDARLSPDGGRVLFVTMDASDPDCDATSLWVMRAEPGAAPRLLLKGGENAQDVRRRLCGFSSPRWSLDGGFAYVLSDAWVTSGAVHQVNLRTGVERFVVDANSLSIIRGGPYAGMLLVSRHKYRPPPELGSYDPLDVVRPDGKTLLTVPGTEQEGDAPYLARWLAAHGATLQ